jgi:imidazolonepropionase-like amidohydrolase
MTPDSARADDAVLDAVARSGAVVSLTLGHLPGVALRPRIAALLPALFGVLQQIRAAGVPVICSSDAGIALAKPHDVLPYGMAAMVDIAGYPAVEALRAATSAAADACRVGDRKGRLAPGYDADILAVAGDPLRDIAALRDVTAVFRAGMRVR